MAVSLQDPYYDRFSQRWTEMQEEFKVARSGMKRRNPTLGADGYEILRTASSCSVRGSGRRTYEEDEE